MVKINLEYKGVARLLSLNEPKNLYNDLLEQTRVVTGEKYSTPKLQYEDLDNDIITISSNSELDNCISLNALQRDEIPRIKAVYKSWPKSKSLYLKFSLGGKHKLLRLIIFLLFLVALLIVVLGDWEEEAIVIDVLEEEELVNSYENETVLIFHPISDKKYIPWRKDCRKCVAPESYTDRCLTSLDDRTPFSNKKRRDVLAKASKPPNALGMYPSITGFLNIVVDPIKYPYGPARRGDPVIDIQLDTLKKSGILDHASLRVRVGLMQTRMANRRSITTTKQVLEDAVERFTCSTKHPVTIEYWEASGNPSLKECETLNLIRNWCRAPERRDDFVFYFHNKGKDREKELWYPNIRDWRNYMMYFNLEKWWLCANSLSQGIPTCGVDLRMDSSGTQPHYSGNYWWARCDWVARISRQCQSGQRNTSWYWLLQDQAGDRGHNEEKIGRSLWDSDVDHYHTPFPRTTYNCIDKVNSK